MTGELIPRELLSPEQRQRMLEILDDHFRHITEQRFLEDLNGKNWVILIHDDAHRLVGFSTLLLYQTDFEGERLAVVYSGDTIIERSAWGSAALPRTWIQSVWRLHQKECPHLRLYWLLLTSGFRTYRFLSVFWRDFHPSCRGPTPAREQRLLNHLAERRFGAAFDAGLGVVHLGQPMREELLAIPEAKRLDPHVAFFAQRNGGYVAGDELVCIAELTRANLTAAGWRMAQAGSVVQEAEG